MTRGPSQVCLEQLEACTALLPVFRSAFRTLEAKIPPPVKVIVYGRVHPRYLEKTEHQAALQKLARYISGLRALLVLVNNRQLQEDGVIRRTLDELQEDIFFLLFPPETPEETTLKTRYLSISAKTASDAAD